MSKFKKAMVAIKVIIAIVAVIIGYIFYQKYDASQKKIAAEKECDKLYHQDKWEEAVVAYKGYIEKYPERQNAVSSRLSASLQNMANDKSIKAMAIPKKDSGKKKSAYKEVIQLLEDAKGYDGLTEMSYMVLCDAYIECNDLDNAKKVIAEAETKSNIKSSKFLIQKRRIETVEKKKK